MKTNSKFRTITSHHLSLFRRPTYEKKDNTHNRLKNVRKEKSRKIKKPSIRIPKNFNYYDLEELEERFIQVPFRKKFCALNKSRLNKYKR